MTNSQLFTQAHIMTKQIIKSGDNYQVTFGLCLKAIKSNNAKLANLSTIIIIAFAIITNILANNKKEVKQVTLPTKKGVIVYANKEGEKVAFEVATICNGGFVAKALYSRQITIFKIINNELVSSNGYVYDEEASNAWLEMYNKEQTRVAA